MSSITDADYISNFVGERLMARGLLGSPLALKRYAQGMDDADSKLVFLSKSRHGLVVAVSPSLFPDVVAEECLKAENMRSQLGDLGAPILEPLDTGRIQASSYAILPYRKPLSKRRGMQWLQRMRVKRHLLEWLLQVTQRLGAPCALSRYEASLQALCASVPADGATAALLQTARNHLTSGRFAPRSSPMHGDLWRGNVLQGVGATAFTLVDWRGSETHGFPIFDLIRAAESFGLARKTLYRELELHRAALGCQVEDLPLYLLGALGHYAARLGEMPPALFRGMADECARRLLSALEVAAPSKSTRLAMSGHGRQAAT